MHKRGGARYDASGNLLTVRKPSTDPAKTLGVSMPSSLINSLKEHCKAHGIKRSKLVTRLIKVYLEESFRQM